MSISSLESEAAHYAACVAATMAFTQVKKFREMSLMREEIDQLNVKAKEDACALADAQNANAALSEEVKKLHKDKTDLVNQLAAKEGTMKEEFAAREHTIREVAVAAFKLSPEFFKLRDDFLEAGCEGLLADARALVSKNGGNPKILSPLNVFDNEEDDDADVQNP